MYASRHVLTISLSKSLSRLQSGFLEDWRFSSHHEEVFLCVWTCKRPTSGKDEFVEVLDTPSTLSECAGANRLYSKYVCIFLRFPENI